MIRMLGQELIGSKSHATVNINNIESGIFSSLSGIYLPASQSPDFTLVHGTTVQQ